MEYKREMEFNNKTILITGLVICAIIGLFLNYEDLAIAVVGGLLGYLAKDPQVISFDDEDKIE